MSFIASSRVENLGNSVEPGQWSPCTNQPFSFNFNLSLFVSWFRYVCLPLSKGYVIP